MNLKSNRQYQLLIMAFLQPLQVQFSKFPMRYGKKYLKQRLYISEALTLPLYYNFYIDHNYFDYTFFMTEHQLTQQQMISSYPW